MGAARATKVPKDTELIFISTYGDAANYRVTVLSARPFAV